MPSEPTPEMMERARQIVQDHVRSCYGTSFPSAIDLENAIAAALAERGARHGCIIDDKGVERKVLGTEFRLTHDGYVVANEFVDVWCIHRGTGKPYRTIPYHAGMKPMYATEEAARDPAAAGEWKVI
jgi:hypothetical protein